MSELPTGCCALTLASPARNRNLAVWPNDEAGSSIGSCSRRYAIVRNGVARSQRGRGMTVVGRRAAPNSRALAYRPQMSRSSISACEVEASGREQSARFSDAAIVILTTYDTTTIPTRLRAGQAFSSRTCRRRTSASSVPCMRGPWVRQDCCASSSRTGRTCVSPGASWRPSPIAAATQPAIGDALDQDGPSRFTLSTVRQARLTSRTKHQHRLRRGLVRSLIAAVYQKAISIYPPSQTRARLPGMVRRANIPPRTR